MRKATLILGLATFVFSSCSYLKKVQLLTGGSLKRTGFVQEIPFQYRKGLIVVEASINDDTTRREFIFDTGAFNSKIEKGLANELGLEVITTKENSTAQGNTQLIEVTRIDSIRFGETAFYNIGAGKLQYSAKSYSPCVVKDGLIGSNLIKLAHWKIDYQNQKLYFSDTPFHPKVEDAAILQFDRPLLSSTPKVRLNIGEEKFAEILFDTGFNGGLVLPSSHVGLFSTSDAKVLIDRSTAGIYGSNTDTLIEKSLKVSFDNDEYHIPVEFSALGKALVGNDFLEHFTVFIDNEINEITLLNKENVDVEPALTFIPAILNDSLWIVNRIGVEHASIRLGDTLRSINGKRPHQLFSNHCDHFLNIRELLAPNSLIIETVDHQTIQLYQ